MHIVRNQITKTLPSGVVINYEYDYMGNLLKETNSLVEYSGENVYDLKGRLIKRIDKDTNGNDVVTEYTYDSLDRLIAENGAVYTKNYYDSNGNVIKTSTGTVQDKGTVLLSSPKKTNDMKRGITFEK